MRKQKNRNVITRGWTARCIDGHVVSESGGFTWSDIKDSVVWLGMEENGKVVISLPHDQKKYIQGKTGSCGLLGGKITIEDRWIGFETSSGEIIKIKIREDSGKIEVEYQ